jgi:hypothetical protein
MAADKPLLVFVPNGPSDFWEAAVAGIKKAQAELPGYKLEPDGGPRHRGRQGHHGFGG